MLQWKFWLEGVLIPAVGLPGFLGAHHLNDDDDDEEEDDDDRNLQLREAYLFQNG